MGVRNWAAILGIAAILSTSADASEPGAGDRITWKKTTIEGKFRSEGVATADVNKDGKLDVLIGDSWYEAPSWAKHDIRKPGDYGDGLRSLQRVHDLLGRRRQPRRLARPDRHRLPRQAPRAWYENPKGKDGPLGPPRNLAQRLQRDAALHRPLRRRPPRAGHGLAAEGQAGRGADGLVHPGRATPPSPGRCTRSASRQGRPRHPAVLARPGRGRPERRRPQGRDLHRRLVGAARVGPGRGPGPSTPPSSATPWPT